MLTQLSSNPSAPGMRAQCTAYACSNPSLSAVPPIVPEELRVRTHSVPATQAVAPPALPPLDRRHTPTPPKGYPRWPSPAMLKGHSTAFKHHSPQPPRPMPAPNPTRVAMPEHGPAPTWTGQAWRHVAIRDIGAGAHRNCLMPCHPTIPAKHLENSKWFYPITIR